MDARDEQSHVIALRPEVGDRVVQGSDHAAGLAP